MFDLILPWWHFIARGALVYLALLVMVRLSGKRTVAQLTPFDLVVVILLGEAMQGSLTGGDQSILGGFLIAATLIAVDYAFSFASARSSRFDSVVEGEPVVLLRRGQVLANAMKRNNIRESDLDEAIRKAGLINRDDVYLAVLETDGEISIVAATQDRSSQTSL